MVETNRAEESPIKKMDSKRIKEIQQETAHSESVSVQQALLKVWNECAQQSQSEIDELTNDKNQLEMDLIRYGRKIKWETPQVKRKERYFNTIEAWRILPSTSDKKPETTVNNITDSSLHEESPF